MIFKNSEEDKSSPIVRDTLNALPSLDQGSEEQDATTVLLKSDLENGGVIPEAAHEKPAKSVATQAHEDATSTIATSPAHMAQEQTDEAVIATDDTAALTPHNIVVPEVDAKTDGSWFWSNSTRYEAVPTVEPTGVPQVDSISEPASQETPAAPVTSFVPEAQSPVDTPSISFADDDERHSRRTKITVAVACAIVAVLAVVYVYLGNYFTTHFFPRTTVNGDDVSGMSVEDLSNYITSIGSAYKVHVNGVGLDFTINSEDISFVYDGKTYGEDAGSQINAWAWPIELSRPHAYVVQKGISYDEAKLNEIVGSTVDSFNEKATQPTNAGVRFDGDSYSFVAIPEAVGTAVQKDAIQDLVNIGVSTMQDEVALGEDLLAQPTISQDSKKIQRTLKRMNRLLESNIKLTIQGNEVFTITKDLTAPWIGVDDKLDITINRDAIAQWAQGPLSAQVDTKGTKREYTRPDGKKITVEGGSPDYDYGWCLDGGALADTLTNNLNNASFDAIELPMKSTGATWNPGGQDWPARYIDVDLSEQHVRMYDESSNVIWESDCVSGNPIYSGGTDTGVFFIYMKSSPMELVGLDYDHDGEPDYRSWVTYWMPFDGGEGLHDMSSRGAFGGNIYSYNGSHGCVNLPYSAAEQLYGITNVGDPVIVHW